jgi:hypothetical protein
MLERFTQVGVAKATAQRHTEAIGLAYEALQCAEVERIERDWPEVEAGPDKLLLSADGAMVPLVGGDWAEVKTLVVGEVGAPTEHKGERVVPTHTLSYFSRMTDADSFQRLTLAELYRRRAERATQVAVVSDGAEWIQGFIDFHCPEARRILDFPHAAQRVCQIGEAVLGLNHASLRAWQTRQLHQLKHHGAVDMLDSLRTFAAAQVDLPVVAENLAYLEKRVEQMQYPTFQAEGWPIGSGMVESANKVLVEARLKGAGMHWSRASVNPVLALRNAVYNDRWAEAWEQSAVHIRRVGIKRRPVQPKTEARPTSPIAVRAPAPAADAAPADRATRRKPSVEHPWRRKNRATKAQLVQAASQAKL